MHAKLLHSCPTLCDPMDYSPPGSSVYGIFQARILEWVATLSSRGSSWPRDWTVISFVSCIGRPVLNQQCHLGSRSNSTYPRLVMYTSDLNSSWNSWMTASWSPRWERLPDHASTQWGRLHTAVLGAPASNLRLQTDIIINLQAKILFWFSLIFTVLFLSLC